MYTNTVNKKTFNVRDKWNSRFDFLFACVGFSVGFGNVWRFPYLCHKHGGGAFLIPYFLCVITAGVPLFFLEVSMGQLLKEGAFGMWNIFPILKGIGLAGLTVGFIVGIYYNVILAWVFRYLFSSFASQLPWSKCDFLESTIACRNGTVSPSEEYWTKNVLHLSNSINNMGIIRWDLLLCLTLAWLIVFGCICKGIRTSGKVMYVTATAPYILLIILLIRGLTMKGSTEGLYYYLSPNWNKLFNTEVWVDAGTQIFFSYSISLGTLPAIGSYNSNNHNVLRDSIIFSFINSFTSFLAGLVIFSVLGAMASDLNVDISEVVASGPGLTFIIYPRAILMLPYPNLWTIIFFIMMFFLGLDSQFVGVEGLITALKDSNLINMEGKRSMVVTAFVCTVLYLLGIPMITEGGMYLFQLFDYYLGSRIVIFIALCELIGINIYGVNRYFGKIHLMIGYSDNCAYRYIVFYLKCGMIVFAPIFSLTLLIMIIMGYKNITYAGNMYPVWSIVLGWIIGFSIIMIIPCMMVYQIYREKGSLSDRINHLRRPVYKMTQNPAFFNKYMRNWKKDEYSQEYIYIMH